MAMRQAVDYAPEEAAPARQTGAGARAGSGAAKWCMAATALVGELDGMPDGIAIRLYE